MEPSMLVETKTPSIIDRDQALAILSGEVDLMSAVRDASLPRFQYFGNKVRIHILDNVKNGHCPEDCGYCAQRKNGNSGIQEFPMKSEDEIFEDAKQAKASGAYRFCMVSSGTGPGDRTISKLTTVIRRITDELNMKVCLSAGVLDAEKAKILRSAGLDRYNHNLNTSESHYGDICTTHNFRDRVETLEIASRQGIGLCSGVIVGMGESWEDLVNVASELKRLNVASIPVNFFIPVQGHSVPSPNPLTPELCIRILCVFRLFNPDAEIRMAAGREGHLRSLEGLGLFVANSLFASGYLNVEGNDIRTTLRLIADAGMEPEFSEGIPEGWKEVLASQEENSYSEKNITRLYKYQKKA